MLKENKAVLLSIIIPVYNVEKYIEKCISSILEQEMNNIEVLIIDDGTPDTSVDKARSLIKNDKRFRIITKLNGGLSSARNLGLSLASGVYIYFIDSDDYLDPFVLTKMMSIIKSNNLDCLSFSYRKVFENGDQISYTNFYPENIICSGADLMYKHTITSMVWLYIFKKSLLDVHSLSFKEGIIHEDELFTMQLLSVSKRFMHSNLVGYNYIQRDNSIMNTVSNDKVFRSLQDSIYIIQDLTKFKDGFTNSPFICLGIDKKIDQLLIGLFIRAYKSRKAYVIRKTVSMLKNNKLFPLKLTWRKYKILGLIINLINK